MNIILREIDQSNLHDANQCDGAITVDSKLVLHADNGVITFSVREVEPYRKPYVFDETDYSSYITKTKKTVFFAYLDGHLAGQIILKKHWNAYAWINDFVVDSEFRRLGVGRVLMQKAVDWAKTNRLP